jgi:arabinofuranosyltransferase
MNAPSSESVPAYAVPAGHLRLNRGRRVGRDPRALRRWWQRVGAREAFVGVVLASLGYAVFTLVAFPKWTVDDAYITFRYAENLARHGEFTYNLGEDPVEGYTGVLLPLALAAGIALDVAPETASRLVGGAAMLLSAAVLLGLLRRLRVGRPACATTLVLYVTTPILYTHATSGLETSLFGLAILVNTYALAAALERGRHRTLPDAFMYASALLCALVRPEGAVFACASSGLLILMRSRERDRAAALKTLAEFAIVLCLPGLAYFAWRYGYYGQLLPNTYYAKWAKRTSPDSVRAILDFARAYAAAPLAAACVPIVLFGAWRRRVGVDGTPAASRYRHLLAPAAGLVSAAVVLAQYARSALVMNYSHRFMAPFVGIVLVCVALLLDRAGKLLITSGRAGPVRAVLFVVALVLLGSQLRANVRGIRAERDLARQISRLLADEHRAAGEYLRTAVPEREWLVVVADAGAIPYYSGLKTVDFGGLNDEFLAGRFRDRIPKSEVVDHFFERRPGAAVFTSTRPDRVVGPESLPLTSDPRFEEYEIVRVFSSESSPDYYELVFLRKDLVETSAAAMSARTLRPAEAYASVLVSWPVVLRCGAAELGPDGSV